MKKGFTLVEIVVALAIISTLTLVVMQIYLTTTKIEIESQEEDHARIVVQNIHTSFVSEPAGWRTAFYASYDVSVPATFEDVLVFDSEWHLLEQGTDGTYTVTYTYQSTYDTEAALDVYELSIDLVVSDRRTIFASIDLGRMVRP
jgi:prepilin-type N-terminal cleavage/methylation domain-containing protein